MSVKITASIVESVNYAAAHLKMQHIVEKITFTGIETDQLVCRITSVPEFLYEYKQVIEVKGNSASLNTPDLKINDGFYRKELLETQTGEIKIEVFHPDAPDTILGFLNTTVRVQAYLHWDGAHYPESMAGFMQPNDPLILQVLKQAGEYAAAEGNTMCGYQCRSEEGVRKQTEYIYRALETMDLHYVSSPASFEIYGQKIRIPHYVLHDDSKQGTCLDLAVLFATCLEAVSLNAVIVVITGHAFAGVWKTSESFAQARIEPGAIPKEMWEKAVQNILPVECTFLTDKKNVPFSSACETGRKNMPSCRYMIDVAGARRNGIIPVYTYTDEAICEDPVYERDRFIRDEFSKEQKNKLELLRDQAMDITTRSRLLNGASEKQSLDLEFSAKDFLNGKITDTDVMKRLEQPGKKKKKNDTLRELYSKSRQNIRESGKSNLYLAVNELRWQREANGKYYNAALYLCPAELYRNGRGDLQIRFDADEVFFNPALKVLLEQGYHLDSRRLLDHPGEKYEDQMTFLRFLIEKQKGWNIREDVARLSLYSIPNEAIWNGLNDPSVFKHEIVSGILAGKMDWENELPQTQSDKAGEIYAFETDSSQNEIIRAAFERKAQAVIGPAGNGKTQTVVNIILEAIMRGEKVLFVSEMAPAMDVAHKKLNQVLDGLFHLRIAYGKKNPAEFIQQLRYTLDYLESRRMIPLLEDTEDAKRKYAECVKDIQQYYELMGSKNRCGKSMEELVDMYEQHAGCLLNLNVDEICETIPFSDAEDQIRMLATIMEDCERAKGEYAEFVRYDNLEGKEEQITLNAAQAALSSYDRVWKAADELRGLLGLEENPSEKKALQQMILIAKELRKCPVYGKNIEQIYDTQEGEADSSYIQEVCTSLKKMTAPMPEFMRRKAREKCMNLLRLVFSPDETRSIVEDYQVNPEEVTGYLKKVKVYQDEDGRYFAAQASGERDVLTVYLDTLREVVRGETEDTVNAVMHVADEIVSGNGTSYLEAAQKTYDYYIAYQEKQKAAEERIIRNCDDFIRCFPDTPKKVLFQEWIENRNVDTNRSFSLYEGIVDDMGKKGYSSLIRQIEALKETSAVTRSDIIDGFYKAWALYHINQIQEEFLSSYQFNYVVFQDKVRRMVEKEDIIRRELPREIISAQLSRMPNIEEGVSNSPEFGVLQSLIRKKSVAIRTFFEQAPAMLQAICPCMIMDPAAVAEYIPSDFPLFDLVIIDEGSQMPTYDALIPISRAKRCMIFGDEKQLPPIDTFKKRLEDEYDLTMESESILTAAYITAMPRKKLKCHYRSENEGLIAFSNKKYYNGDIVTFPSCDTRTNGVTYEFVEDGVYDRDGTKGNIPEARRVVQYISELYNALPEGTGETLGVITLNVHQRDLIQSMLLEETKEDPSLGMKTDELVSIVNLESCQGKEWDYVVISPGFGNDSEGKFHMGFGALNREDGANRLNVMITRARKRMHVITSIEPYMLSRAQSEGVQNFREFLKFAKGDISIDSRIYDRKLRKKGLVDNVAAVLEANGYEVHTNIGSSDLKVDIGIVSKEDPSRYCMGILLDHFKDGKGTIHDKEVNHPENLKRKGWKIYRLRELSWIQYPNREIRQILKAMEVG